MNEDELRGTARDVGGKLKEAAGGLTGDTGMHAQGKVDQAAGQLQDRYGAAKEAVSDAAETVADKAGSFIGNAGDYVQDATQSVRAAGGKAGEQVYASSVRASEYAGGIVKQQPFLSLLGIAAIAYAVSFFIHSPSSPFASRPTRSRYFL